MQGCGNLKGMFLNALFSVIIINRIQYLVNIGFKKDLSVSHYDIEIIWAADVKDYEFSEKFSHTLNGQICLT